MKMAAASAPAALTSMPSEAVPTRQHLFRKTDWLTFLLAFAAVWLGYYLTLAPELTLEDSGELATGSFYAGIPHPPGYPLWTIYTWLWTVLVPFKNVAWRVALGEATSGALAAGLLALLVSRGSSLLMEGIEELKAIGERSENAICTVSGFVAGLLLGFNGFMWSQSVIVEVYSFSLASLMVVLLCLLRWIYTPHKRRYLYVALLFHGICFTNHQTLIVAAIGIEVAIAAADFRMGRELFLGNSILYVGGVMLNKAHILTALDANQAVFVIFHVVGICSVGVYLVLMFLPLAGFRDFCRNLLWALFWLSIIATQTWVRWWWWLTAFVAAGAFVALAWDSRRPGRLNFLTRQTLFDAGRNILWAGAWLSLAAMPTWGSKGLVLALCCLAGFLKLAWDTRKAGSEWLVVLLCGLCWIAGASFYFYMPLAGMTNPPMEWGYPRTFDGFIHAFTRGQYEKTNPSDVFNHPDIFFTQLRMLGTGIIEEFNWVYAFLALIPFLFFFKLHKRERAWCIGITAIYLCLGVLLLILLNPPPDRGAQQLVRVFFTASHTLIALMVGYGLTLVAAFLAARYRGFRPFGIAGAVIAAGLAILSFIQLTHDTYFGQEARVSFGTLLALVGHTFTNRYQYGLPVYAGLILLAMTLAFLAVLLRYRNRPPLAIVLAIFALIPLHPILTHWSDNEQRGHWFGYWFGHDMFSPPFQGANAKPLYPPMTKDAVLFGGTDPGRFCPTYMIFCDSFIPHRCQPAADRLFDRRDVYIITQNALADPTYLEYIRAQYNRSAQKDTPFFGGFVDFLESQCLSTDDRNAKAHSLDYKRNAAANIVSNLNILARPLDSFFTDLGDRVEKRRRTGTSWFTGKDFLDLAALAAALRPSPEQDPLAKYIYDNLSPRTRELLAIPLNERKLRPGLAKDLNRLLEKGPLFEAQRFRQVPLSAYLNDFIQQNPQSHTRIRLNRLLLEAAYPKAIATSLGGVYPAREIHTPSGDDFSRCFGEYMADAQRRLQHDLQFPKEPPQIRPGEDVHIDQASGRVQIGGQVAIMSINGLLTKVIFDQNPKNEFFVEESLPLDWMYPYLAPFGIIMKVNRQPLKEMTPDILERDHQFWTQYSKRLIGDWITYDTSVKELTEFAERVYLRRDFTGFTGDRRFVRDDQAQKSFSKLRSSIAGVYAWRLMQASAEFRPKSDADYVRLLQETEFAFRQAFAFCPYSPEAVARYVNLLLGLRRFDDALLVVKTCLKLDPYNGQFIGVFNRLQEIKKSLAETPAALQDLERLKGNLRANPGNFQAAFDLAGMYLQLQQTDSALGVLDGILNSPSVNAQALRALLQAYSSISNTPKLQATVDKLQAQFRANPSNLGAGLGVAEGCHQLHQTAPAFQVLDGLLNHPLADANVMIQIAQQYATLGNYPKLQAALEKLVRLAPNSPEANYDLAAVEAVLGQSTQSLASLRIALDLSAQRLKSDPKSKNLLAEVQVDARFTSLRQSPEFKQLCSPKP